MRRSKRFTRTVIVCKNDFERTCETTQCARRIVFGAGEYAPETHAGKRLLAHELMHVGQQGSGAVLRRKPAEPADKAVEIKLDENDYQRLAYNIYLSTVHIPGTDEESVYRALLEFYKGHGSLARLEKAFEKYDKETPLLDVFSAEFDDEELEYALALMGELTDENSPRQISAIPTTAAGLRASALLLYDAGPGQVLGTDEEAIFAILTPLSGTSQMDKLKKIYEDENDGQTIEQMLKEEMSGAERDFAMELLKNTTPFGSISISDLITKVLKLDATKLEPERYQKFLDAQREQYGQEESFNSTLIDIVDDAMVERGKKPPMAPADFYEKWETWLGQLSSKDVNAILFLLGRRVIGTEFVRVKVGAELAEEMEARRIMSKVRNEYGITFSSHASVEAVKKNYAHADSKFLEQVHQRDWELEELQAIEKGLAHYAPILGRRRASSSQNAEEQRVTTIGKTTHAFGESTGNKELRSEPETHGQSFVDAKNVSIFKSNEAARSDFHQDITTKQGTVVHELAHLLLMYGLERYIKEVGYWKSDKQETRIPGAEAPITRYGAYNAYEDMAEAVMFYFLDPTTLLNGRTGWRFVTRGGKNEMVEEKYPKGQIGNPCPIRYKVIASLVAEWKKGQRR